MVRKIPRDHQIEYFATLLKHRECTETTRRALLSSEDEGNAELQEFALVLSSSVNDIFFTSTTRPTQLQEQKVFDTRVFLTRASEEVGAVH